MSKDFYEICKSVVGKLELTKEQGIARDVILNMLDMKEEESKDYLTRINKAIEYIEKNKLNTNKISEMLCGSEVMVLLEILGGDVDNE